MSIVDDYEIVIATAGPDGKPTFIEAPTPKSLHVPGAVEVAFFWEAKGIPLLFDDIGGAAETVSNFPLPGGSKFGIVCFPAHSAGKLDVGGSTGGDVEAGIGGDASMHQTNSIDYEIILSGKVDIELPGGEVRTLRPGSLLVMGGVPHAWKNHYDEPCVYAAIVIGAHPAV